MTAAGADPYEVLGVGPTATLDDAEDAYHLLLRRHHPDLYQTGSPAGVRAAEQRTRQLNDAISLFRSGQARPAPTGRGGATNVPGDADGRDGRDRAGTAYGPPGGTRRDPARDTTSPGGDATDDWG